MNVDTCSYVQETHLFSVFPVKSYPAALLAHSSMVSAKNAISPCRVTDKHMSDRSHKFAVLDNGTAAHSLNYAARFIQQPFIGHMNDHIPAVGGIAHIYLSISTE